MPCCELKALKPNGDPTMRRLLFSLFLIATFNVFAEEPETGSDDDAKWDVRSDEHYKIGRAHV